MLVVLAVLAAAALFFVLRPSQGAAAACVSVGDSLCREIPLTQEQAGHTLRQALQRMHLESSLRQKA